MSRVFNFAIPVTLLFSALALSACASKPEAVSAAESAPVAAVVEKPSAPEVTPESAPAPAVIAEQTATSEAPAPKPKPVIRKARKITAKHKPAKAPPPVVVPAPVEHEAPAVLPPPQPSPPVTVAPPVEKVAQPGFLERYWLWLLALGVIIAGVFGWLWRSQGDKH